MSVAGSKPALRLWKRAFVSALAGRLSRVASTEVRGVALSCTDRILLIYFVINFTISTVSRRLQRNLSIGRGSIGD